jgi:hypothetical protein
MNPSIHLALELPHLGCDRGGFLDSGTYRLERIATFACGVSRIWSSVAGIGDRSATDPSGSDLSIREGMSYSARAVNNSGYGINYNGDPAGNQVGCLPTDSRGVASY